ncbi:hypothetical protein WG66_005589 [Moniliophthora roreri]|nr:hypothetical protein WG66_005589 [Moniliophthora roreri]
MPHETKLCRVHLNKSHDPSHRIITYAARLPVVQSRRLEESDISEVMVPREMVANELNYAERSLDLIYELVFLSAGRARRRRLKDQRSPCTFWIGSTTARSDIGAELHHHLAAAPRVTTSAVENESFAPVCYHQHRLLLTAVLSDSIRDVIPCTTVFVRLQQGTARDIVEYSFK